MKKATLILSDETIGVTVVTVEDVREIDGTYSTYIDSTNFVDIEDGDTLDME